MSKQTLSFQAEVKQILHLVTHSLYSNKEIFLRELISNASDACDKLRFEALNHAELFEDSPNLEVRVAFDAEAKSITITDNGIGLSEPEAVANLGTIAKSGTREFMAALEGEQKKDAQLIGQFGVGFYSGFIVADRITVESRRAGLKPEEGVRWTSDGTGDFEVETITRPERGTSVILHLRDGEEEFLSGWKLRSVIGKYSDHISLPILMRKEEWSDEKKAQVPTDEWQTVNKAAALWTRNKAEIKDDEYNEFYKHIAHDFTDPLTWSHNRVEGKQEYTSLLYIPSRAPFDLNQRDAARGLKLYVKRVFITDEGVELIPPYLRFLRGVVDSADLPLNISRETLQKSPVLDKIRDSVTGKVLTEFKKRAEKVEGKFVRQSGGKGQYGHVVINIEPAEQGQGFVFEDKIVGGVIPREYIGPVEQGIKEALENGVTPPFPASAVRPLFTAIDAACRVYEVAPRVVCVGAEGDLRKAFSTPHVEQINGRWEMISLGVKAAYGYDPFTGKELWRVEERGQHSASTRPVLGHTGRNGE